MSYYARTRVMIEASLYSDYGAADTASYEFTDTPTMWEVNKLVSVGTTPTEAIDTIVSYVAGVKTLIVKNTDATNYVTLVWRSAGNSGNDNKVRIAAGELAVIPDVTETTNPTLQANTAACLCRITIMGT